jgi:DNA-binding protein Fis
MNKKLSLKQLVTDYLQEFFKDHSSDLSQLDLHRCVLGEIEEVLIRLSLKETNNNQSKAAKMLGINRHTIKNKIKEFNIELDD